MNFLGVFKHLLPNAKAWRLTPEKKLRKFFSGLSGTGEDARDFLDGVYSDIDPATTRELTRWEGQFGLRESTLTTAERRTRLDATWKALGGQSPRYIQDILQANGFNVFVHEWWEPGTEPAVGVKTCTVPRNPLTWLRRSYNAIELLVECGEPLALCGEAFAEAGNSVEPRGYPLVNKIYETSVDYLTLCGESGALCGEPDALAGSFTGFIDVIRDYIIPLDVTTWPYFLYIGGEVFGDLANVDSTRRDEFEDLCLKICPAQQWLGILVNYN